MAFTASRLPLLVALLAPLALAGCVVMPAHRAEYSSVCKTADARGWQIIGGTSASRPRNGQRYWNFGWLDDGSRDTVRGPLKNVYWVLFSAGTTGSGVGAIRLPMVYDPRDAVLHIGGRDVHALPRLWIAQQDKTGLFVPDGELPVPSNLNTADMPFPEWFYMAFPGGPPGSRDTWQLDGGSMLLGDERVPLPVGESCFEPSKTWLAPIN